MDDYKEENENKEMTTDTINESNELDKESPNQIIPQESLFSYVSQIEEIFRSFSSEDEITTKIFEIYDILIDFIFQDSDETVTILKKHDFFPIMNNMMTTAIEKQLEDPFECIISLLMKITRTTTKISDLLVEHEVLDNLFNAFDSIPQKYFITIMNIIFNILHDESIHILEAQIKEENIHINVIDLIKYSSEYNFHNIVLKTLSTILIRLQNAHIGFSDVDGFVPSTLTCFIEKFNFLNFEKPVKESGEEEYSEFHSLTYLINSIASVFILADYRPYDMNGIIEPIIEFIMNNWRKLEELDVSILKALTNIVGTIKIPEVVQQIQDYFDFAEEFSLISGYNQQYQRSLINLFMSILNFEICTQNITLPPEAFESLAENINDFNYDTISSFIKNIGIVTGATDSNLDLKFPPDLCTHFVSSGLVDKMINLLEIDDDKKNAEISTALYNIISVLIKSGGEYEEMIFQNQNLGDWIEKIESVENDSVQIVSSLRQLMVSRME